jgi:FtsH-binding integral membrane protein
MSVPSIAIDENEGRSAFLVRTYLHLLGSVVLFALIEVVLFSSGAAEPIARAMMSVSWLLVLGGFILVGWLASLAAHAVEDPLAQYAALATYVLSEALIFVPLLYAAEERSPGTVASAAALTVLGFAALTLVVFQTRKDFSFLRPFLVWTGLIVLLLIVASVLLAAPLGFTFTIFMVGYAGAAILYDTSSVLRDFPADRHVAAALELFASIALLFWYLVQSVADSD